MSIAIRAEQLSKQYHIGTRGAAQRNLREALNDRLLDPMGRKRAQANAQNREFWALRDISFDIPHGSSVGLIGHNGSGKSTLLKLLARVTRPTEGRLAVRGRLGSLIEVGVGFHPELSGRDNVFLNGSILGMSRAEIVRKFDEIVDFSGIEQFIDTPVKYYSTGMYLRLAFSVSIHLDPDILLIDEVFAVGDQEFQRKCMRRLAKARDDGQTIVLVSHAMNIIAEQCKTAIWLNRGRLVEYGDAGDIISTYVGSQGRQGDGTANAGDKGLIIGAGMTFFDPPGGTGGLSLDRLYIADADGNHIHSVDYSKPFSVVYEYRVHEPLENLKAGVLFSGADHSRIVHATSGDTISAQNNPLGEVGTHRLSVPFPARWFKPGAYTLEVSVTSLNGGVHFYERNSLNIYVDGPTFDAVYDEVMHPTLDWTHMRLSDRARAEGQIASTDENSGTPRGVWW